MPGKAEFSCEDSFFDAVVSVQVIHHADMATIRGIVAEIGRVLKKGGLIFVLSAFKR